MQLPLKNQKTCEKMSNILTSIGMVCQVVFALLSELFSFKKLSDFASFFHNPVRLGNADRIWVSTPQNHTIGVNLAIFYSVLVENITC